MTVSLSAAARKILDGRNPAVLCTVDPDGGPQSSVVWVGTDGDDLVVSSQAGRRKVTNLAGEPRVSLSVYDLADPQRYVEVRGTATVSEDIGRRTAVALAEKYEGPGAGQEYLDLPPDVVRVTIRITPERLTGNSAA
ncbi:PPOX class F420-dependent oxidoreductase [Streptomyces sp. NPDC059209]|uniref:PPOX class F420-dependent oxidoreductase n=1 Tax=Streptomyces sp. NPDC059209 TaxID=3346769 RepID=UPI0036820703